MTISTGVATNGAASSTVNSVASANALLNTAASSAASGGGGGGGGWSLEQGVSGVIQALHVEGGGEAASQPVCLDDKAVPYPASQVSPERSLLRRYGAGIKVLKAVAAQTCVAYRNDAETTAVTLNMSIDGGVGGVVH